MWDRRLLGTENYKPDEAPKLRLSKEDVGTMMLWGDELISREPSHIAILSHKLFNN